MTPERKRALRAQIDRAARDMQGFQDLARENMRQWGIAISRAEEAEAEAADLRTRLAAAEAQVAALTEAARPFADVADLFDSEVEGVGVSDTLSLWLNGDNEDPAWRAMDFKLGDFGALSAALATVTPPADTGEDA